MQRRTGRGDGAQALLARFSGRIRGRSGLALPQEGLHAPTVVIAGRSWHAGIYCPMRTGVGSGWGERSVCG